MMTSSHDGQSATILQFPAGGRAGLIARRERSVETTPLPVVECGSWYHEEAIREAELPKKH